MNKTIKIFVILAALMFTAGQAWGGKVSTHTVDGGSLKFYSTYDNGALSNEITSTTDVAGDATVYIQATPDGMHSLYNISTTNFTVERVGTTSIAESPRRRSSTPTGPGMGETIDVTAVNAAKGIFSFTMPVTGDVKVSATLPNQIPITITAASASKAYDGSPLTTADFTVEGLGEGDTHKFTVAMTAASTITDVGNKPNVIATVDGINVSTSQATPVGNYLVTIVSGTLTVNKAPGSIAFAESAYEKTYGDEDFTNALTIIKGDGIVSYASSDKKVASVDPKTGVVSALREGTATITATMGSGKNYHGASASFEVTVHEKVVEDEAGKGITLDADGYHFVINENEAIGEVIGSEYTKVPSLEYTRTLQTAGKTAVNVDNEQRFLFTLCVPFEPGFAAKFYTLSAVEGTVLKFEEVKKPKAYTPYLVATTKDVSVSTEVVIIDGDWPKSDSKRAAADNKNEFTNQIKNLDFDHVIYHGTPVDGYQLKGTLRGMSNADAAAEGAYIMQNSGKWGAVKAGKENVYIPLFRAYIVAASQNAQELNNGFDGGTTAIRHIVTVDQDGTERWYDLNGRPVEKPATKGVYIHDGKKVVIK